MRLPLEDDVLARPIHVRTCCAANDPTAPPVHLRLVNGFRAVHRDEGVVQLTPVCERLVAFVALRGPAPRHFVAFRLWPDHTEEQALGCLRTTLWRLPRPGGDALVHADAGTLRLADGVDVDVHRRYEDAECVDGTEPSHEIAVDDFAADILPGWFDDWALMERERFRQMRLHVLEHLSMRATRSGRFADAIRAGARAVEGGSLRESAHRCLVRAHLAEGNVDEAVRQVAAYLADLTAADLPRRLSPAMRELLAGHAVRLPAGH